MRSARTTTGASGTLLLVVVGHEYHQDGVRCVREQQTLVYRDPPADPVPLPVDAADVDVRRTARGRSPRRPEPTLLFRFSAITFNTHRIHYDLPYARDVEGYPGLVVQGPLTAMTVAGFIEQTDRPPPRVVRVQGDGADVRRPPLDDRRGPAGRRRHRHGRGAAQRRRRGHAGRLRACGER